MKGKACDECKSPAKGAGKKSGFPAKPFGKKSPAPQPFPFKKAARGR